MWLIVTVLDCKVLDAQDEMKEAALDPSLSLTPHI